MKNEQSASIKTAGSIEGSGAIRFAVQRKEPPVASVAYAVKDSFAGLLPAGIPSSVRQKVQEVIESCVVQVLLAVASIKDVVAVAASNVNRVTRNGDEYLLHTQNGRTIALRDCKMVRLLLMFVSNPHRALSFEQIQDAERFGHYMVPAEHKDGLDHDGSREEEDGVEFQQVEPSGGKRRASWTGKSREELDIVERTLRIGISQASRDTKRAKADGDQVEVARIRKGRAALQDKLDDLIRERSGRSGPVLSPKEKKQIRRIQMAVRHFIDLIAKKDEVLAAYLDSKIIRNGHFEYFGDPLVQWEVCDNVLAAINRKSTPIRDESHVQVTAEG